MDAYMTTRKLAKAFNFPEHAIRMMIKAGTAVGFYSGNRFYHETAAFQAKLAQMSRARANVTDTIPDTIPAQVAQ